jgi:hypothetical protein
MHDFGIALALRMAADGSDVCRVPYVEELKAQILKNVKRFLF